jgi:hypothetical protein
MREARITTIDRMGLLAWPFAWALVYYALTLHAVWGRKVHPIQAMFLMFGMMATAVLAASAAGIWLALLSRRDRLDSATALTLREVGTFGLLSGALPMTAIAGICQLLFAADLGAVAVLGLVASAGVAGTVSALGTSGIVALRARAGARMPAGTETT